MDEQLCCVSELAEAGTLHHLIFSTRERGIEESVVWHLFLQICHGLHALHEKGITHRALKTRNLLLFQEDLFRHGNLKWRCKLADVRVPAVFSNVRLSALSGSTLRYLAPEVHSKKPYDSKVDVWSLGCVLHEMLTHGHSFNSTSAILKAE